jgi:hypothetical protein
LTFFIVPSREVVSEVIDGEAVILDLRCGRYYTADGVGAAVWEAALAGMLRSDIVESCRTRFPAQPAADRDVDEFLEQLVTAGLLVPQDESARSGGPVPDWPDLYSPPVLEWSDDLADMMALDPVHNVGPAGWPSPPTT